MADHDQEMNAALTEVMSFGLPPRLGSGWTLNPPDVLYHYTSLQGFMGIMKTNRVWATNARFLNDVNDSRHLWLVAKRLVLSLLKSGRTFPELDLEELLSLIREHKDDDSFVASFSEARDALSQWRAYSGGGPGICIGFSRKALQTQWIHNPHGEPHFTAMQFSKVEYLSAEDPKVLESLEALLTQRSLMFGSGDFSRAQQVVFSLSMFHTRFKDPAFSEELEWRLSFKRYAGKPMRHQQFRVSRNLLVPYIEAQLNKGMKMEPLVEGDYVREVLIGPSAHSDLIADAVKQFLIAEGRPDIPVTRSQTPYRDW